jgi:hypothetical protein
MGTVSWLKGEWFAPDFSENEIFRLNDAKG